MLSWVLKRNFVIHLGYIFIATQIALLILLKDFTAVFVKIYHIYLLSVILNRGHLGLDSSLV